MTEIEQEGADLSTSEALTETEDTTEAPEAPTQPKKEYTTAEKLARVSRLKQRYEKELGIDPTTVIKVETPKTEQSTTGGLDETQLDYLDLKGVTEQEDIEVIEAVMKKTGQTVRQALKDDYVATKLKANADKRAVQAATPGGTRRSGSQSDNLDAALAKFEATGELPKDFDLRAKVVNAKVERDSASTPPWMRRK